MGVSWLESDTALAGALRRRGLDPDRVDDVATAWKAFCEFLAEPVDGLEPDPEADVDGFIVQWGRYDWNDGLPSLSFTRQFAVDVRDAEAEDEWYQPEYWQVSLEMVFDDAPALADVGELEVHDSGFDFSPPGPERDRAIDEVRRYPALSALWASIPSRSAITLDQAG